MSDAVERITGDRTVDGDTEWLLHQSRYRYAAGFCQPGDYVVDAACGMGYGADILNPITQDGYIGVDKAITLAMIGPRFMKGIWLTTDLTQPWPHSFWYDVWVGLETIEHLDVLDHYIAAAHNAAKYIVISTPIVPTTAINHFHVRDFTIPSVIDLFVDDEWALYDVLSQGDVYGLFAFERCT